MANFNISRKPEQSLKEGLIKEMINLYGIPCKWLYSEKINTDFVFRDFSGLKVGTDDNKDPEFKDITILPEDTNNWEGEIGYQSWGRFNDMSQNCFISKADILKLYPDFYEEKNSKAKILNSLLLTPSGTFLEVTNISEFEPGINNLWAYADTPSSYKLTVKVYTNNLADEGLSSINTQVVLDDQEAFSETEDIDTSDVDEFFNTLSSLKEQQDIQGDEISSSGGPFGSLG